jgi:hypothetical protein
VTSCPYQLAEVDKEQLLNYWKNVAASHMSINRCFISWKKLTLVTSNCSAAHALVADLWYWVRHHHHVPSWITYKKRIVNLSSISSSLCTRFQYVLTPLSESSHSSFCPWSAMNYISMEKYVRISFLTHMVLVCVCARAHVCVCEGKHEVALLYNWLAMFRLSI